LGRAGEPLGGHSERVFSPKRTVPRRINKGVDVSKRYRQRREGNGD